MKDEGGKKEKNFTTKTPRHKDLEDNAVSFPGISLSVLLILIFLSYREDFFGNRLLDCGLVEPGARKPGATSGPPV
jgi:hypothetical protein